ncbi:MAG: hypothetical protein HPY83_04355 [Anaerolineae bacterium]|nr:hypothetical protein [Anaerolineae bacterium]
MQVRRTQDPEYWRKFRPDAEDLEALRELIVDARRPVATDELARAVVFRRVHQERDRVRRLMEQGRFYRPADAYEEGEELIFPALEFATGVVTAKREGHWPGHAPFKVIAVQLGEQVREFASEYQEDHPLNELIRGPGELESAPSPEEIYRAHRGSVMAVLAEAMAESEIGFVTNDGLWLVRELMPEVHVGYLNLAEAVIEVTWEQARGTDGVQGPLSTAEILEQIELEAGTPEIATFALELALSQDERFVDVGSEGEHLWLLHRLVPQSVLETPERLRYEPVSFSMEAIPTEALGLIWGIPDELSSVGSSAPAPAAGETEVEFALPYPHWRAGTLPLASPITSVLPRREEGMSIVTLVDEQNHERLTVWVSHKGGYASGLAEWYQRHEIPSGGYLSLSRTEEPDVLRVAYRAKRRTQREYVRVAVVADDRLGFEIRRQPMGVEFDETLIMLDDSREASDRLWRRTMAARRPVAELLREVFGELAKLSPQGTVHFNTLYSAVNVLRRCPPEPILAELSLDWRYVAVGSGYFAMDERAASQER